MLRFLTSREYSLFDGVWLVMAWMAFSDREWITAALIIVGGALTSSVLEVWSESRE